MGIREAWQALTTPKVSSALAVRAASVAGEVFGMEASKDEAHGMLAGIFPWGLPPKRGTRELMMLYAASPWLRAVTHRIGMRVGSTTWRIYALKGRADGQVRFAKAFSDAAPNTRKRLLREYRKSASTDVEEILDHPMLDFLRAGNLILDGRSSMQVSQTHWDLKGDVYWLLERHDSGPLKGKPKHWWPVPPFWVMATPTTSTPWFRFQYGGWNAQVPETEVVWARDPDPANPYGRGVGIAESLQDELQGHESASKLVNSSFFNRCLPAAIVSMKGGNKAEAQRIQEDWTQKYGGGALKALQTHFTSSEVSVAQLSQSFVDMQVLELRKEMKADILQTFGYPAELLGDLSGANRSTIDTAAYRLEKYVIEPRREFWRHVLQNRLAREWDERIIVEYENEVPEDAAFLLQAAARRPYAFTNNEIRQIAGKPEVDDAWGEERPPTPTAPPVQAEKPVAGGTVTLAEEPAWAKGLLLELRALHGRRTKAAQEDDREDPAPDWDPDDIPDPEKLVGEDELIAELAGKVAKAIEDFGNQAFGALDAEGLLTDEAGAFSMSNPTVATYLEDFSSEAVGNITETTRSYLKDFLSKAYANGDSIDDMVAELTSDSNFAFGEARAENIARTETLGASNFGTLDGFKQSGVIDKKVWLATPGTHGSRESHEALDGKVIGVDEDFTDTATGAAGQCPGDFGDPASDCQCRCAVSAWVDDPEGYEPKGITKAAKGRPLHGQAHLESKRAPHEAALKSAAVAVLAKQRAAVVKALKKARKATP
jgi:phage portal protein BeeE